MSKTSIQDILPLVQMPSRYLGREINHIKKSWDNIKLHVALAFPDLYEIATSHFGIQILYEMLNKQEEILAERVLRRQWIWKRSYAKMKSIYAP
jgi:hypothetical protein